MTGSAKVRPAKWTFFSKITLSGLLITLSGVALLSPMTSRAASGITYQFDNEFSSGTPPAGPAPWITATIQTATPGTVLLTVANNGLVGSEFVSGFYLNLNPNFNPVNLSINYVSSSGSFTLPSIGSGTIERGTDSFKADGDGKYDVLFYFSTSSGTSFGQGIGYLPDIRYCWITADDFVYLSAPMADMDPLRRRVCKGSVTMVLERMGRAFLGAQPILVPGTSAALVV
jgi:hypothetical protein